MKGRIASVNIGAQKGAKTPVARGVRLIPGFGAVGDCHAGTPGRELSLLPSEVLDGVPFGGYGENIDTEGIEILSLPLGTILRIGEGVRIEITQKGKDCPAPCSIYHRLGKCVMQQQGLFARILTGGVVRQGDEISLEWYWGEGTAGDRGA